MSEREFKVGDLVRDLDGDSGTIKSIIDNLYNVDYGGGLVMSVAGDCIEHCETTACTDHIIDAILLLTNAGYKVTK